MFSKIIYTSLVILLYIYLNNPYIASIGVGTVRFLYPLLLLLFSPNIRKKLTRQRKIIYSFIVIITFVFLRTIIGGDPSLIKSWLFMIVEVGLLSNIIVAILRKNNIDLIKIVMIIGALSSAITLLALVFPSIDSFFREYTNVNEYLNENGFRGFGLSEGLTYSYGIVLALIGGLSFPLLNKNRWFIIFLPLLVLSILVNARTGFIVLFVLSMIYFLTEVKTKKKVKIIIIIIFGIGVFYPLFNNSIVFFHVGTSEFIQQFFLEIKDFFDGTSSAQNNTIGALESMIILPDTFAKWILGTGEYISTGVLKTSDIGYVLQLNYGGIVYVLMLVALIYNYLSNVKNKYIFRILLVCLLVSNIKGDFLTATGGFRLFALLCYWFSYTEYDSRSIS